jgi:hypothetical protein
VGVVVAHDHPVHVLAAAVIAASTATVVLAAYGARSSDHVNEMAHELHEHVHSALEQVDIQHVLRSGRVINRVTPTQSASKVVVPSSTVAIGPLAAHHMRALAAWLILRHVFVYVYVEFEEVLPQELLDHLIFVAICKGVIPSMILGIHQQR